MKEKLKVEHKQKFEDFIEYNNLRDYQYLAVITTCDTKLKEYPGGLSEYVRKVELENNFNWLNVTVGVLSSYVKKHSYQYNVFLLSNDKESNLPVNPYKN